MIFKHFVLHGQANVVIIKSGTDLFFILGVNSPLSVYMWNVERQKRSNFNYKLRLIRMKRWIWMIWSKNKPYSNKGCVRRVVVFEWGRGKGSRLQCLAYLNHFKGLQRLQFYKNHKIPTLLFVVSTGRHVPSTYAIKHLVCKSEETGSYVRTGSEVSEQVKRCFIFGCHIKSTNFSSRSNEWCAFANVGFS